VSRTTLTLEPDVSEAIDRLREREGLTLKEAINRTLRLGLIQLERPREPETFRTRTVSLEPRTANVDDIAEVLTLAEGDAFR
jgi:hypothetical protein